MKTTDFTYFWTRYWHVAFSVFITLLFTTPAAQAITFTQISAGYSHTCGLKSDSGVICWGDGSSGQTTAPSGIFTQLSAGGLHSCGLKSGGSAICWGSNQFGQSTVPSGTFTQLSAGYIHTCGLKSDGSAVCWGYNAQGQSTVPSGIFTQLSAGFYHTCGLKSDGSATCWGAGKTNTGNYPENGQSIVPSGTFTQLSVGNAHTCGLKSDGGINCWGWNGYGQTNVPGGTFTQLSAGYSHTCGIKSDGSTACWGWNDWGQSTVPSGTFTQLSAGREHTCGLKSDGSTACWGNSDDNRLRQPVMLITSKIGNGTVASSGTSSTGLAIAGLTVGLAATPDVNYTLTGWSPSPCANSFVMPANDLTCTANFAACTYTLSSSAKTHSANAEYSSVSITTQSNCSNITAQSNVAWASISSISGTTVNYLVQANTGTSSRSGTLTIAGQTFTINQLAPPFLTVTKTGNGTVTSSGTYNTGSTVNLTATPNVDSTFTGWSPSPCANSFVMPANDLTCNATFALKQFTLTVSKNSNVGTISATGITCGSDCSEAYNINTPVVLTATPNSGYLFNYWSGDCSGIVSPVTVTMNQAKSCTANFVQNASLALSKTGNGSGGINGGGSYLAGATVNLTATPDVDSTFTGWSPTPCANSFIMPTNNLVCTANFTLKQFALTISKIGDGTISATGINCGSDCNETYNINTAISLTATPATGFKFANWSGDCNGTVSPVTVTMDKAKNCTANFTLNSYSITSVANPIAGGSVSCNSNPVNYGSSSTCTATPSNNFKFINWLGDCNGASCVLSNVTTAKNITANFALNSYPITVISATGGTVSPSSLQIEHGNTGSLSITPPSGFVIDSVSGCNGALNGTTYTTGAITAACEIRATFKAVYALAVNTSGNGQVSGSGNYAANTIINLTATPNAGYKFVSWNPSPCANSLIMPTNNLTCGATFELLPPNQFPLTVNKTGDGMISGTGISCGTDCNETYNVNTQVVLTATPATGYNFSSWSGCDSVNGAQCVTIMSLSKNITANFTISNYSITSIANPVAGGSVSCTSNLVNYGNNSVCTATPNTGYTFANFSGDCNGTSCTLSNITSAKSITASFALNSYSITSVANPVTGGNVSCNSSPVNHGSSSTCTAIPSNNFKFINWSGDCSGTSCVLSNITTAKNITANFALNSYPITVISATGGTVSPSSLQIEHGNTGSLSITPSSGFVIDSVSGCNGALNGTIYTTGAITAACEIRATFKAVYALAVNTSGNGQVSGSGNYAASTIINLTATPNAGYKFVSWSPSPCANSFIMPTNNLTCSATFEKLPIDQFALTANKTGDGIISGTGINCGTDCSETYNTNTSVVLTATPATAYNFSSWNGCDSVNGTQCVTTMSSSKNITANFTVSNYSITSVANPTAGGSVSCTSNLVNYGNNSVCIATPNTGYIFTNFSGDCSGTSCTLSNVTSAKNITANFTLNGYSITTMASPVTGGNVSCNPNSVTYGGNSICTATPVNGFKFVNWSGDCSGTVSPLTLTIDKAKSCGAIFEKQSYPVTVTSSAGGLVNPSSLQVEHGNTGSLSITPSSGFIIDSVIGCNGALNGTTYTTSVITSGCEVKATFKALYVLTVNSSSNGQVSGGGNYATGSTVNLTATPNVGYQFKNWSPVTCMSSFAMPANNLTCSAIFELLPPNQFPLTISKVGNGTISGTGISCGTDCNETYNTNTQVVLTATPAIGFVFENWAADCVGTNPTTVIMDKAKSCVAGFLACTYSLNGLSNTHSANAETGSISITTPPTCSSTATSYATWIKITQKSDNLVSYSVEANPSIAQREGTVNVAGQNVTIIQNGIACSYTLSSSSKTHSAAEETGSLTVNASNGCLWTVNSNASWLTLMSASGTGISNAIYKVTPNPSVNSRSGKLIINGQFFDVIQLGVVPQSPIAQFTASPKLGEIPLQVNLDASKSYDPDGGDLVSYEWVAVRKDKQITLKAKGKETSFRFDQEGIYSITLIVTDNEGQTTETSQTVNAGVSELSFNTYRCAISDLNGFAGCQINSEEKPYYTIGSKLKVTLDSQTATNRFERLDLWVGIQLPKGEFLFMTSQPFNRFKFHQPPQYNGEAFMPNVEFANREDTVLEFDVPLHFSGKYIFYALYVELGRNPLLDSSSWRSNLAFKEITLE